MKKFKRVYAMLLSLILTLSLFANDMVISVCAQDKEEAIIEGFGYEELEDIEFTDEEYVEYLANAASQEAYEEELEEVYAVSDYSIYSNDYCKNMLNDNEKRFYNELYEDANDILTTTADCVKAGSKYIVGDASYEGIDYERAKEILGVFIYQNPQFYFISTSFMVSTSSQIIAPCSYDIFADGDERADVTNQMFDLIEGWTDELSTRENDYQIIRAANDIVCNHVIYGDTDATYNQTVYSAVILKDTVCAGYTKFYHMLLNGSGVDCVSVTGSKHAWSIVNLYGTWYNVDTTWSDNDETGNFYYDYFLKADLTIIGGHIRENIYYSVAPDCLTDYNGNGEEIVPVSVTDITLDKTSVKLDTDEGILTELLVATIVPENATDKNYSWGTTNPLVAVVSDTGLVTAVAPGTADVYAVSGDGYHKATCKVEVYGTHIMADPPTVESVGSDYVKLKAITGYEYSMDKTNWQSSNIFTGLTPDKTYTFYARKAASTYYKASAASAGTKATTNPIYATGINLSSSELSLELGGDKSKATLSATVVPENATDRTCSWKSSDTAIATVSDKGEVVAVYPGEVDIIVTSGDGYAEATCEVTVYGIHSTPAAPKIVSTGTDYVKLEYKTGYEYSMDKVTWQDSNTFTGLSPNKDYTFYIRRKASTYYKTSGISEGTTAHTLKISATVTSNGLYVAENDNKHALVGMTTTTSEDCDLEYQWMACKTSDEKWFMVKDWTLNNEWLDWEPAESGDYVLVCKVRVVGNEDCVAEASVGINHHKYIKGKCQMPYTGEGGGYLIGFETYDNPGGKYRYEMLILDCTLLAEGKDAWTYTTGQCLVPETSFWTIWQPQYGYYWTLFRLYDENGNLLDEECYGFENIC